MVFKGCYNLIDSLNVLREEFWFDSVGMLFQIYEHSDDTAMIYWLYRR